MGVTRRGFVVGAAAACAACGTDGDTARPVGDPGTSTTTTAPTRAAVETSGDALDAPSGPSDGFGSTIDLGPVEDVAAQVVAGGGFHYVPEGRSWITRIDETAVGDVEAAYGPLEDAGMPAGFVALHQKCPHLGCRVPECRSSQRFECPCHGSVFTHIGEWVSGPATRGMDRFRITAVDGRLLLDTSVPIEGAEPGTRTVPAEPAGPSCIA